MHPAKRIFLTGKRLRRFEALQRCLVPRSQKFTSEQQRASVALVNGILSEQPRLIHFKIALFFWFIDFVSICCGRHMFVNLNESAQLRVMDFFFNSRLAIFRKGFWGVSTLAKLGVYGQSSVYNEIGYKLRETPR